MKTNIEKPPPTITSLALKSTWTYSHEGVHVEIAHCGTDTMNNGKGVWNYYLLISEYKFPSQLSTLWLEPSYDRWTPTSPLRKHFEYMRSPLAEIPLHGGISFYDQLNPDIPGSRAIEIGCDYNHLYDEERGHPENLASVFEESLQSCKALSSYLASLTINLN